MCKVYNEVGCISAIMQQLHRQGIKEFRTLDEVVLFLKTYPEKRVQIFHESEVMIEKEKSTLDFDIKQLDYLIEMARKEFEDHLRISIASLGEQIRELRVWNKKYFFQYIYSDYKELYLKYLMRRRTSKVVSETPDSIKHNISLRDLKVKRYHYILHNFNDAVRERGLVSLRELERRKMAMDQLKTFIYGAYGELDVVNRLKALPNDSILINDFATSFFKPLYYRSDNSYIKTIQADHILVCPAGIFVIETKNWSEQSLNNLNLFSPIQQLKRTSFALYKIINEGIAMGQLKIGRHHWGERKLPLRNIVALSKIKPTEEFQYVKILLSNELVGYISYFKPIFSNQETEDIANYLLSYSNRSKSLI
jgi:hypothetical protein